MNTTSTKHMTTTTKRKTRQCARCEGTDPGCNVCQDEPQEAIEWPTHEDIEFFRDEAKLILKSKSTGEDGTDAGVMLRANGSIQFRCYGYIEDGNEFLSASGMTMEAALDELARQVAKADPVAKLAAQARKQGFDIVKREEGKA